MSSSLTCCRRRLTPCMPLKTWFRAAYFLRRGLSAAFGISESRIWLRPSQDDHLRLIGSVDMNLDGELSTDQGISITEDRLEARAYRYQVTLRGQEAEESFVRAIPLMVPGGQPIGVVTIYEELSEDSLVDLRERDLQMAGYLNQATRALQTVSLRRQELTLAGRVQASLLPEQPPDTSWLADHGHLETSQGNLGRFL